LALPVLVIGRTMFEQYEKRVLELNGPDFLTRSIGQTYLSGVQLVFENGVDVKVHQNNKC